MKSIKLALVSVFTAALAIGAAQMAHADNLRVTNLGSHTGLNMRSGPSTGYGVITTLPSNARNINWSCNKRHRNGTTWYQIDWHGHSGWAAAKYLKYMRNSHKHCTTTTPRPVKQPAPQPVAQPSGHGHTHGQQGHSHSHSHGHATHSHAHTHNGSTGHNVSGHGGGNHTSGSDCQIIQIGPIPVRLCMN